MSMYACKGLEKICFFFTNNKNANQTFGFWKR